MQRVVLLRSNPVQPDPPVEKLADALLGMGMQVRILAWGRSQKENSDTIERFPSGTAQIVRFGIPAAYGARWATLFGCFLKLGKRELEYDASGYCFSKNKLCCAGL